MKPSTYLIGGALVAIAGLSWFLMRQPAPVLPPSLTAPIYAYDLNRRELFVVPANTQFPCPAPSGDLAEAPKGTSAGVRCLAVRSPDGKIQAGVLTRFQPTPRGEVVTAVRNPADPWWHSEDSAEGRAVVQRLKDLKAKGWVIDVRPTK